MMTMVKKMKNGVKLHVCKACGFAYKDKKWADACYQWCSAHNSCNIEITKHAMKSQ